MAYLSICIPTMDSRKKSLDKVLTELGRQMHIGAMENLVEICVSSHNGTKTYDENLADVIWKAKGDWCWEVCDDDDVEPDAVENVLEACRLADENGCGAVYLNHKFPNGKIMSKVMFDYAGGQPPGSRLIMLETRKAVKGLNLSFGASSRLIMLETRKAVKGLNLSFGASVCVRRDLALKAVARHPKHVLEEFLHTYLFLECVHDSNGYAYQPIPCIWVRASEAKITLSKRWFNAGLFRRFEDHTRWYYNLDWREATYITPLNRVLAWIYGKLNPDFDSPYPNNQFMREDDFDTFKDGTEGRSA